MSKHTPGPWVADYGLLIHGDESVSVPIFDGIGALVCAAEISGGTINAVGASDAESEKANVALIEAAPDLLEALKDTLSAMIEFGESLGLPTNIPPINRAKAAIAKAEGR